MHERVDAVCSFWNIKKKKKKKIRFAQHCVLIADKGNHLLQTVAPPNQGRAGCLLPGSSRRDILAVSHLYHCWKK